MQKRKFYVVWEGRSPGIYDSWEECKLQTDGFDGARYKAFESQEAATNAFRGDWKDHIGLIKSIASHKSVIINYEAFPEIKLNAISVDGACAGNPGMMEYRGVMVADGSELFRVGPLPGGSNNIAEYLALVHALALFDKKGDYATPIYTDSVTGLAWLRRRGANTKITPTPENIKVFDLLKRADAWLQSHVVRNPIFKWKTEVWGEIPADFGRKK